MSMAATRTRGMSEMREWFIKGQEYLAKRKRWEDTKQGPEPRRDLQLEGIAKQLTRELPTHMHAQTAIEMQYALQMQREFGLEVVIVHGFDAWKMIDDIKKAGRDVSVCYGPIIFSFADDAFYAPGLMVREGIKVALQMDSASDFQKHALHQAQICVRFGMDPMEALKAVTINPAEMGHVADRVGSLAKNKDGDVVILDGDPLSTFSHVLYTVVEGEVVYERAATQVVRAGGGRP
jgi:imidazolonepropionase-like amidohydrolase